MPPFTTHEKIHLMDHPGTLVSPAHAHLSVVIPVYHARDCMSELYRRLVLALESITPYFELVLVEDCGGDGSWEAIAALAARDPRVKGIQLSRNFGQHYAITAGLDHASGDWVVVMDCDLQDQPEEIEKLYRKAQEGYDMVFARRAFRKDSWGKTLRSRLFNQLMGWLTGEKFDGALCSFSISSKRAILASRAYRERDRAFFLIMKDIGFPLACLDVEHAPRFAGETSYTWGKLFRLSSQVIVSSSTRPLHLSIRAGTLVAGLGFLAILYLVLRYFLMNIAVVGWTSLIVVLTFFFGLLLIQLGVIGLYIGKTFEESKRRPLYHINEFLNRGDGA